MLCFDDPFSGTSRMNRTNLTFGCQRVGCLSLFHQKLFSFTTNSHKHQRKPSPLQSTMNNHHEVSSFRRYEHVEQLLSLEDLKPSCLLNLEDLKTIISIRSTITDGFLWVPNIAAVTVSPICCITKSSTIINLLSINHHHLFLLVVP